jgi:hypothetical protein
MAEGDIVESAKKIEAEQQKQIVNSEGLVKQQTELWHAQQDATVATTEFVTKGIGPATTAMIKIAKITEAGAKALDELTPGGRKTTKETVEDAGQAGGAVAGGLAGAGYGASIGALFGGVGAIPGAVIGTLLGSLLGTWGGGTLGKAGAGAAYDAVAGGPPGRASGGDVDAGKLYKVGERGEEYFRPDVAGEIVPHNMISGITSAATGRTSALERSAKEIVIDTKRLEKITDTDADRAQRYSLSYKEYVDIMTEAMQQQIDAVKNPGTTASGAPTSAGTGLQMPRATNIGSMGGGQGLQSMSQADLIKMGLNIKAGDVQAGGAGISPRLIEMAKAIQGGVPGFGYFSAFNDRFHQEKASSSKHTSGLAADFTVAQAPNAQDGQKITDWLKQMGASLAIDEYNNPSSKATAGHFHVEIPAFETGGNLGAGKIGIAGENGRPELITGPASITPNNDIMSAFNSMNGLLQQSVVKLDDLLRAQKDNNDISNKMLKMQS